MLLMSFRFNLNIDYKNKTLFLFYSTNSFFEKAEIKIVSKQKTKIFKLII
jgi:hypothetical protein